MSDSTSREEEILEQADRRQSLKSTAAMIGVLRLTGKALANPSRQGEPFVGVHIAAHRFYDEGIEHCLDFLTETAGVNMLFVTSNSYDGAMFRPKAAQGYHGVPVRDGQGRKVTRIFSKMARRMFRNMATNLNHTLDEPTAGYLEKVAWEEYQAVQQRLKENRQ